MEPNALSHHWYFMPKEGDETYEQQCDIILKLEYFWLQALIILDDTTFFYQICEKLEDPFVIGI
jgi:hypothetical protein